ncbi:MATE family efflux transporter [Shewanella algae]|uniref:MATE family efflux transporter n=1 Tax=Shewanella algae TaxID=38313 RepID=UPI0031F55CFF
MNTGISQQTLSHNQLRRTFWRYTIPAIAAMLVSGLYQISAGIFVGHYVGFQGLAAINMAWPIVFVLSGLGLMVGMGGGSHISIARGAGQQTQANRALLASIWLIVLLALVAFMALQCLSEPLMQLQGATEATLQLGQGYIAVFQWGAAITIASTALPMLIRNDDSPRVATALLVMGALGNILLDYLFVAVLGLGLNGAAYGTIIAQTAVCLGAGYYLCSSHSGFKPRLKDALPRAGEFARIVQLGASALLMYLYTSFMVAVHNHQFMQYGTTLSVSAFAIVGYLMTLYYLLAEGIAEGVQPPVSYFHGARQPGNIIAIVKLGAKVTLLFGLSWLALLNLFPETMIGLFADNNPLLTQEARTGIRIHLAAIWLEGLIVLAAMYFMAIGKGGMALAISLTNMLIQLPFLYLLPLFLGETGVWLAMPLSNLLLALLVLPRFWRHLHARSHLADGTRQAPDGALAKHPAV